MSEVLNMFLSGTETMFGSNEFPYKIKRKKALIAKNEIKKAKKVLQHTVLERASNRIRAIKEEALS
jgi:hypothetical protein